MKKEGFFFNMNTCIACGACQVACKDHNNLQPGEFFRRFETMRFEGKDGPVYAHYSGSCNHCEDPVCVEACLKAPCMLRREVPSFTMRVYVSRAAHASGAARTVRFLSVKTRGMLKSAIRVSICEKRARSRIVAMLVRQGL